MDVSKAIAELEQLLTDCNEVINDLRSGEFQRKVAEEAATAIYEDVDIIFNQGVMEWYNAYPPTYYKRQFSFLDMFEVYRKNRTYIGWNVLDGTVPGSHRVAPKYIFDYMWEGGWHGGAVSGPPDKKEQPHPGGMAYRTPVPWEAPLGIAPYSFWSSKPGEHTTAPSTLIGRNLLAYQNGGDNYSGSTLSSRFEEAWDYIPLQYALFSR